MWRRDHRQRWRLGDHIAIRYMEDVLVRGLRQEMGYSLGQRHALRTLPPGGANQKPFKASQERSPIRRRLKKESQASDAGLRERKSGWEEREFRMKGKKQDLNSARGQKDTTAFPQMLMGTARWVRLTAGKLASTYITALAPTSCPGESFTIYNRVCIAHLLVVLITQQQYTMGLEASCSEFSW